MRNEGRTARRIDAAEIARFEARAKSVRSKRLDLTSNTILSALHKLIKRDAAAAAALRSDLPQPTISSSTGMLSSRATLNS